MTCVLQLFVVVVALIIGGKRCNGHAKGLDTTENEFRKFWSRNINVLRLWSTNEVVKICTWFQPKSCDDIGVNIAKWVYFTARNKTREYLPERWIFGENDSMWKVEHDGITVSYLLYTESDGSCSVIGTEYYHFEDGEDKDQYVKECEETQDLERCKGGTSTILNHTDGSCVPHPKEPGKFMCGAELTKSIDTNCENDPDSQQCKGKPPCIPHPTERNKYMCRDNANYHLLVSENRSDVPDKCGAFFTYKVGSRGVNRNENIDDCKPKKESDRAATEFSQK